MKKSFMLSMLLFLFISIIPNVLANDAKKAAAEWGFDDSKYISKGTWMDNPEMIAKAHKQNTGSNWIKFAVLGVIAAGGMIFIRMKFK